MRPHNGGINHGVLVIGIPGQVLKDLLPATGLSPAREAGMYHPIIAKAFGQVAPGGSHD